DTDGVLASELAPAAPPPWVPAGSAVGGAGPASAGGVARCVGPGPMPALGGAASAIASAWAAGAADPESPSFESPASELSPLRPARLGSSPHAPRDDARASTSIV